MNHNVIQKNFLLFKGRITKALTVVEEKKIAIIELTDGHNMCIDSQVLILKKAKYKVFLIINEKIKNQLSKESLANPVYIHRIKSSSSILELIKIIRYVHSMKINKVIFNTAENAVLRNLALIFWKVKFYGILHNIKKLENSITQKIISLRIKKYFILNDYLSKSLSENLKKKVESFYALFFPEDLSDFPLKKKKGEFWITVPGQLEYKRRDYEFLIENISKNPKWDIKIILLGNSTRGDGPKIKEEIKKLKIESKFIFFNKYVDEKEYHSYIKNSDLIMPLVHPEKSEYTVKNITGSFNFAFAYKIPILLHESFSDIDDFLITSIFYSTEKFSLVLGKILKDTSQLKKIKRKMESYEKFTFDFQYKKFIETIEK